MKSKPMDREQLEVFDRLLGRLEGALDQAKADITDVVNSGTGLLPTARIENLDLEEMSVLKMMLERDSDKMRRFLEGENEMPDFDTTWFREKSLAMKALQEEEELVN